MKNQRQSVIVHAIHVIVIVLGIIVMRPSIGRKVFPFKPTVNKVIP